jgi:hypothetical protein
MNNNQELLDNVYIDQTALGCNQIIKCPYKERTISFALGVSIPTPQPPEEIFKECCYTHLTLADLNSSEDLKTIIQHFSPKTNFIGNGGFVLYHYESTNEHPLIDETFGSFYGFGSFPDKQ